jgi:SAM-dependent methyltransferase
MQNANTGQTGSAALSPAAREGLARMLGRMPAMKNELLPPEELLYDGSSSLEEYRKYGEGDARLIVELGGLKPTDRVLDMGCGIGQKTRPLTQYLTTGTYEGLDIMPQQVEWCQKNITPRYPNFRFQRVDVYSKYYNPEGQITSAEYRFPFNDAEFDFAYLVSVFTHMMTPDLEHYMEELARVVKPGGRTFITYFLYDDKALKCMFAGGAEYNFEHPWESEVCRVVDLETPEYATAHEENHIREVYKRCGFEIIEPIRNGYWSGRDDYFSALIPGESGLVGYLQDIIVAVRK